MAENMAFWLFCPLFIPIYWGLGRAVVSLLYLEPYIFYFDNLRTKGVLDRS